LHHEEQSMYGLEIFFGIGRELLPTNPLSEHSTCYSFVAISILISLKTLELLLNPGKNINIQTSDGHLIQNDPFDYPSRFPLDANGRIMKFLLILISVIPRKNSSLLTNFKIG